MAIKRIETSKGVGYKITVLKGTDSNGKQQRVCETYYPQAKSPAKAKKEAEARESELKAKARGTELLTGDRMSFEKAVKEWKKHAYRSLTQSVQETYDDIIRRDLMPRYGTLKVAHISTIMCQDMIDTLCEEKKSFATISKIKGVLSSIMKYLKRMKIIKENPVDDVEINIKQEKEAKALHFFTEDQARRFLKSLENPTVYKVPEYTRTNSGNKYEVQQYEAARQISFQWKIYFYLAIVGGFRRGEMLALTWRDIDPENSIIRVNKAVADTKAGQIIKKPKTTASIRAVAMDQKAFVMLEQWKQAMICLCKESGNYWKGQPLELFDDQFVFIQNNGDMMNLHTPTHKMKELIQAYNKTVPEDLKLPEIRLHDLRHTTATLMIADNTDIETVAQQLGHADVKMTLNRYGHALPSKTLLAAQRLGSKFN